MKPVSFEVEIDAKPNTQEFSDKMFSAMAKCMNEITKDFYPNDKRQIEYLVKMTNGDGYKVIRIEHLSPKYMTIDNLRYFKTKEQAEKYRNSLISKNDGVIKEGQDETNKKRN